MDALAEVLGSRGVVDAADLARARNIGERTGDRLAATLVKLGLVAEDDIVQIFADLCSLPRLSRSNLSIVDQLPVDLNPRFLKRRSILPLMGSGDGLSEFAMADPGDAEALEALRFATGCDLAPNVATFSDIDELLSAALNQFEGLENVGADYDDSADDDIERLLEASSDAPAIRLVQSLLARAAMRGASDVHIEPMARHLQVRYRIDGRLIEAERLPDSYAGPIASRIKILASLDIAESRLPQDGRLRLMVKGQQIDVRVSTSPTAWGESIVLRLLGRTAVPLDLDRLGLPPAALAALTRALAHPHGIILLTGPTGSGKTTTLYAAISRLKRPEVKILTVEDPVEVLLDGINQVQVRPDIALGYPETLRAFLRQDPDILMIGEIRDRDTADIAMRAALTGHLVLSTLHTNSALGAFTRLADLGVEPYLTASTVIATVAQRLVRTLCQICCIDRAVMSYERDAFDRVGIEAPARLSEPVGCPECHQTGYKGRTPLIEVVEVDDTLRQAIRGGSAENPGSSRNRQTTLYGHGLALVAQGVTALSEIERAVQEQ